MTLSRVAVIGGGTMGAGIAEVIARAGVDVMILETSDATAAAASARLSTSLARAVKKGLLTADEADAAQSRVRITLRIEDFADRELVIEAAPEIEQLKVDLFTKLDAICGPEAILATNTSSLSVTRIGAVTARPGSVVGLHFFNPVPVLPLVEIVRGVATTDGTVEAARAFAEEVLGKKTVIAGDRSGFIVNALLVPFILSAVRMHESGFASAKDIDDGMVLGCNHPIGPLALADLVGLDVIKHIADAMYAEYKDATFAAPPSLLRLVEAGYLGRKSGRGFYPYS